MSILAFRSKGKVTPACACKSWDVHEINNCCFYLFETKRRKKQEFSWYVCAVVVGYGPSDFGGTRDNAQYRLWACVCMHPTTVFYHMYPPCLSRCIKNMSSLTCKKNQGHRSPQERANDRIRTKSILGLGVACECVSVSVAPSSSSSLSSMHES